ncbi:pilus assembly protein [Pelagibius litoralis]|uniref:Pilus assembly protein n=1 Tax=Pelagibius litoralis TaxID=374515 RepID=A0A967KGC1_9PROT|nr:TadE/TadG family type IV pilus assembly protein [Pelagibius litoralis]NIA70231.1 pilus assembly protein [Pelagibius litoralis]
MLRDNSGGVVIEFALVAPPFFLLMAGLIELSIMFFTSSVIEGATKEAARAIRTGQVQSQADPVVAFQNQLCGALYNVIDCTEVIYNVRTFSDFGAVSMPIEVDENGDIINNGFVPGGSSAVTVVRAMYRWHFTTPLMDSVIPTGPGGSLLVSTVAFQNEPYDVN